MDRRVDLKNNFDSKASKLMYEDVTMCPICKAKILPVFISASLNSDKTASVFDYCQNCKETFLTQYEVTWDEPKQNNFRIVKASKLLYCEPNRFEHAEFDVRLESLSPRFVKIYNQALAAECGNLDEIAGLGFRKAVEFLVKDYAIHNHPDEEDKIKTMNLSTCIRQYIDDNRITVLAERSAWIGNDEAHYVRKQKELDVSDMKTFIQALVYFVSMTLVTEDASRIEPQK